MHPYSNNLKHLKLKFAHSMLGSEQGKEEQERKNNLLQEPARLGGLGNVFMLFV